MARVRRPDWAVCRNYGQTTQITGTGADITADIALVTSTEIAFYEDRFRIKKIMGQVEVTSPATAGTYRICQRLRMGLEDQTTGTTYNHGVDLAAPEVAEEHFLNEKRFRLIGTGGTVTPEDNNFYNNSPGTHPWWSVWDQTISRTLEPGEALLLSTQWILSTDMVNMQVRPYLRFLVETW